MREDLSNNSKEAQLTFFYEVVDKITKVDRNKKCFIVRDLITYLLKCKTHAETNSFFN